MFEQSLLLQRGLGKHAAALTASLTLQIAGAAVLLLIPLIYSERLPFAQASLPMFLPPVLKPLTDVVQWQPTAGVRRRTVLPFQPVVRPSDYRAGNVAAASLIDGPDIGAIFTDEPSGSPVGLVFAPLPVPVPPRVAFEPAPPSPSKPVLVASEVQAAKLIRKIVPIYPYPAKLSHVSGKVRLTGTIAKDGTVRQLQVIGGHPLLVQAALEAVRQWVYAPTLLRGDAVEVITSIEVNFVLER